MKKTIITLTILITSFFCFGQKQDVKPDTATYILIGKIGDFQLLYKALISAGDVTPNQFKALASWIEKIQALPSKEADKPKEKPKN